MALFIVSTSVMVVIFSFDVLFASKQVVTMWESRRLARRRFILIGVVVLVASASGTATHSGNEQSLVKDRQMGAFAPTSPVAINNHIVYCVASGV